MRRIAPGTGGFPKPYGSGWDGKEIMMDLGLRGKVALVGGSSRGLGYASARRLAEEGASVVLCARTKEHVDRAAQEIRDATGSEVLAVAADLSAPEGPEAFVGSALERFGHVDILVHNTGGPPPGDFFAHDDSAWGAAFDLLLLSAIRTYRLVLPSMRERGWGRIVNLTSVTVKEPWADLILSNVFRTGLVSLAKTLSRQLAPEGILINSVCPGSFRTERAQKLLSRRMEQTGETQEQATAEAVSGIPVGRIGEPEELANVVAFLCSDRASYMTGVTMQVDGGSVNSLF
ncbi:MAG: SDR family oxidoreductase [Candidatus Latescibacterota bacterium]